MLALLPKPPEQNNNLRTLRKIVGDFRKTDECALKTPFPALHG
jgi:hypothetical protein